MNLLNSSRYKLSFIVPSLFAISLIVIMLVTGTSAAEAASKKPPTRTPTLTPSPTVLPIATQTPTPVPTQTLNGTWRFVNSPNANTAANYLNGVAVISANDVWAVGSAFDRSLIMHWDGSPWQKVLLLP